VPFGFLPEGKITALSKLEGNKLAISNKQKTISLLSQHQGE
jgi:hypothetical protein